MKQGYRKLGDFIRQVDDRNKKLITKNVLGINIDKYFMPSVANVMRYIQLKNLQLSLLHILCLK